MDRTRWNAARARGGEDVVATVLQVGEGLGWTTFVSFCVVCFLIFNDCCYPTKRCFLESMVVYEFLTFFP